MPDTFGKSFSEVIGARKKKSVNEFRQMLIMGLYISFNKSMRS